MGERRVRHMAGRGRCAVVGAMNIDIGGFALGPLAPQDSNPGRVRLSVGGVGHNIACSLARLGVKTHLAAPLGRDAFAEMARADCARAKVDLSLSFAVEEAGSSCYLFIADAAGEMQLAVNDMAACEGVTEDRLAAVLERLNGMDCVVLDANLPAPSLRFLSENLRPPRIADAVSAAKAPRLLGALEGLWALKPNALEAEALTGIPVKDADCAARAARRLVQMGARRVFITLGERGACCADAHEVRFLRAGPVPVVNATGAGDAFTAALAWSCVQGLGLAESCAAGLAAAAVAIQSPETVSPEMDEALLRSRMDEILRKG